MGLKFMEISREPLRAIEATPKKSNTATLRADRVMANNNRPTEQGQVIPKFNILWY
jgi:hypothetical protein